MVYPNKFLEVLTASKIKSLPYFWCWTDNGALYINRMNKQFGWTQLDLFLRNKYKSRDSNRHLAIFFPYVYSYPPPPQNTTLSDYSKYMFVVTMEKAMLWTTITRHFQCRWHIDCTAGVGLILPKVVLQENAWVNI